MSHPTPTALKIVNGNPGKRAFDPAAEPQFDLAVMPPPDWLDEIGAARWRWLAPRLARARTFTEVDVDLVGAACERWSVYIRLSAGTRKGADLVTDTPSNGKAVDPRIAAAGQVLKQYHQILAEFGVGAGSRTRIKVTPAAPKETPEARRRRMALGGA